MSSVNVAINVLLNYYFSIAKFEMYLTISLIT